jgi:hypothetical protein
MFEAFSVAVKLKLLDGVSTGLMGMASQFALLNRHIVGSKEALVDLEKSMQRIKTLGLLGGAAVGIGGGMLYSLKGPLDEAKAWAQESAKFASLGFGAKVNADAQQFAVGMKTYGTSARENLTLVSDAMAVFKDLGNAEMAAPILAKMKFGNEAVFGKEGGANESKFMDMLKVIEMRRGLSSPGEFQTQANFVQKVISGSRNRVDASQMLQALKTGGVALSNMSNDDFYLGSEGLIQEFGGMRYGTAMNSIYQNVVQGRTTAAAANRLMQLGLLDPSKVHRNKLGSINKFDPGAFAGTYLYSQGRQNPLNLLEEVLLPAYAKKGITKEQDVLLEIGRDFTNRTGAGLLARAYQQREILHKQWDANRNAENIDQMVDTGKNTPAGKQIQLRAQYHNLFRELGISLLPIFTRAVEGLSKVLAAAVGFAREFPGLTKGLVIAFASLAGLMVAGGSMLLITAGFKALGLALVVGKGAGIGSMLLEVAGGLGGLTSRLGKLGLLAGVGVGAYEATRWVADKITPSDWTLGGQIYDWTHSSKKSESPYIASGSNAKGSMNHGDVYLDGRKVGAIIDRNQAKAFAQPQTGPSYFNGSSALDPVGGH